MPPDRDDKHLETRKTEPDPDYEGGARKYPRVPDDGPDQFDQRAADNKRRVPYGLTEPLDQTQGKTARSENVDPHLPRGEDHTTADHTPRRRPGERK